MGFDIRNIPAVIQGTESQPGRYGASAHEQYMGYLNAAKNELYCTGDPGPLTDLSQSAIRYTPEGTIAKGQVSEASLKNALGYASADIEEFDKDGDHALSQREVLDTFISPYKPQLAELAQACQNPYASNEEKANASYYRSMIIQFAMSKASNYMDSVDTTDGETGCKDGKITADEAAAKLLFDDTSKQMFEDNSESYQRLLDCFQANGNKGPSFAELQEQIQQAIACNNSNEQLKLDGMITTGEQTIGDILTDAPVPTNLIVSGIHEKLKLKQKLADYGPFGKKEPKTPPKNIYL